MDLSGDDRLQHTYARWLDAGMKTAFAVSLLAFVVYLAGWLPAFVPLEAMPRLWGLPVSEYLLRTGAPSGWGWLALMDRGEYLNLACVALIACVSLACYLRVAPEFWRSGDRLEAALAAAQITVLLVAASGLLA